MITAFGTDIWLVDGPVVTAAAGFHYPTRMVIVRLANGGLWLWSPVALVDVLRAEVDALGPVRHIVAPNDLHHVFITDWAQAYPQAVVWAAQGVAAKQPGVQLTELDGEAPEPWHDEIAMSVMDTRITTELWFTHRASGTLIVTDLLQQMPRGWFRGWRGLVARMDLMVGDVPQVPRKFRLAIRDRAAARQVVDRMLAGPIKAVVMAHGAPVTTNAGAALRDAFAWLR